MKKDNSWYIGYFLFLAVFFMACNYAYKPSTKTTMPLPSESYSYENLKDPEQVPYINLNNNKVPVAYDNVKAELTLLATYRIYAQVMSKAGYGWDWNSRLSPYDLALAWNDLMLPQNQVGINYWQSNRWYYFQFDGNFPLNIDYIYMHSSNHHIIPANQNVLEAIKKVDKGDKIYMEGYLVNVDATVNNSKRWWHSSLTRLDRGDGACEVFYVKKAVLNNLVYQ